MHSVLVWISCSTQKATQGLLQLVTVGSVRPRELSEFFWRHLEKDLELLCRALNKNMQEALLVLHLVIQRMGSSITSRFNTEVCYVIYSCLLQVFRRVLGPADKIGLCGSAIFTSHTYSQLWRFGSSVVCECLACL